MELKCNVTLFLNLFNLLAIINLSVLTLVLPNQLLHVSLSVNMLPSHKLDLSQIHLELLAIWILDGNLGIIEYYLFLSVLCQLRVQCRLAHLPHQSHGFLIALCRAGGAHDFEELLVNRPEVEDEGVTREDGLQLLQVLRLDKVVENVRGVLNELLELVFQADRLLLRGSGEVSL